MKQKTSLKEYIKDKRNWYHSLIALTLGFDITLIFFSNRENFPISWEYWNNSFYPLVCGVIVGIISGLSEYRQDRVTANVSDMRDVYNGIIFATIGGYLTMIYANWYVAIALTIISAIIFIQHYKK